MNNGFGPNQTPEMLRGDLIIAVQNTATGLLLDPGLNTKKVQQVEALQELLSAYESLARATSTSNPGYVFRDLPQGEKSIYEGAKHILSILHTIVVSPGLPQAST